jgi:hypothetical protein
VGGDSFGRKRRNKHPVFSQKPTIGWKTEELFEKHNNFDAKNDAD